MNVEKYHISSLFVLLLIGGLIGLVTFLFLFRYRKASGVKYWLIWELATSVWAFTYAFELAATDIETKIFWSKLSYLGIVYCTVSFFFFSLEFSGHYQFLKKKFILGLYGLATFFILSPFTNDYHHLHWKNYSIIPETNTTGYIYGPFFWIIFIFSYLYLIGGILSILVLFLKISGVYRRQLILLFVATLLPPLGNLIYVFHINPIPGFDWTPFTFLLTGILIAINISEFKLFELIPFAHEKLTDMIPDAILIVDNSSRIADLNPAMLKLLDSPEQEIIGRLLPEVIPSRQELIQKIISQDEFQEIISDGKKDDLHYYDLQVTALYDHHKQISGRLFILKDITTHVKAEDELKAANLRLTKEIEEKEILISDLDSFSHTVAHDLKSILGVIVTSSNLISAEIDKHQKEDLLELNEIINQSAIKTIQITNELLTLASVRQQEINPVPVNMLKVIRHATSRLKNSVTENKAHISIHENWPDVLGYEGWLEEVWINYLSNAIKYGGNPPEIEIGTEVLPDDRVKFWIKDNGNGLSETEIDQLFNKYTRLETVRAEGHGLGLSIVKRIIEKLNGQVGAQSNNIPGEGTTFYFILPSMAKRKQ
ncbi:MAG: histidine kinase N-terminal 7TM domain-containing protein [Prolixibacteraceae bacterium]